MLHIADSLDPLTLTSETATIDVNGRTLTREFTDGPQPSIAETTPALRQRVTTLDEVGRVIMVQLGTLAPTSVHYDPQGRVDSITRGSGPGARTYGLGYDPKHRLKTITDPLLRQLTFTYDDADRIIVQTLPDMREIGFDVSVRRTASPREPGGLGAMSCHVNVRLRAL